MKADVHLAAGLGGDSRPAEAMFDSGSTVNFISEEMVRDLGLKKVGKGDLDVYPFLAKNPVKMKSQSYLLHILLPDGGSEELIAYRIKKEHMPNILGADLKSNKIEPVEGVPDLLIGMPQFWRFFRGLAPMSEHLFQVNTSVGPIVCGEMPKGKPLTPIKGWEALAATVTAKPTQEEETANFWSLETIGVTDSPLTVDDEEAMRAFQESVHRKEDGRFVVKWPWKADRQELPSNFSLAFRRLASLMEKLNKSPELKKEYSRIMADDLKRGIIEITSKYVGITEHYLPHHPVVTPKKVRPVFDASSRIRGGKSLNECLYRGPVILPDLAGLLIRFRIPKVAMWADIEKAFHTLELEEEERNVVKFLWVKDVDGPMSAQNLQVMRFVRVPFGVVSSPFLLSAAVQQLLENVGTPLALEAKQNSYIDNILVGFSSAEEAWKAYGELKKIFESAKMNLREFVSNDLALNGRFPEEDKLGKERPKILGIPWDLNQDKILLVFPPIEAGGKTTRRVVLKEMASIFDPLGLLAPALVPPKRFFQTLWEEERKWDDRLKENEEEEWQKIVQTWKIPPIQLDRRVIGEGNKGQLHVFSDASAYAYAACVYLRVEGEGAAKLIYARSRLKPKKMPISIPRMELLGALIAVRAAKFVKDQIGIEIENRFVWCDSKPVLGWIENGNKLEKFVENRVREMRGHVGLKVGYVPTGCNPADVASRGCDPATLAQDRQWWEGPSWLAESADQWPAVLNFVIEEEAEESPPADDAATAERAILLSVQAAAKPFAFEKWNKWEKMVRAMATAAKAAKAWLGKIGRNPQGDLAKIELIEDRPITATEYGLAENWLYKMAQSGIEKQAEKENWKLRLSQDGVYRMETRMENSELDVGGKSPIIFPKGSGITSLLMGKIHTRLKHAGVDSTLGNFLAEYWTPGARRIAKIVVKSCQRCRRMAATRFALPDMPSHPTERVNSGRAFEFVGVDYLGPSYVKINGVKEKFWLALFTCFTTRAVHLEIAWDLSAECFLHLLRRFSARRGLPTKILSDNGGNFSAVAETVGADIRGKWKGKNKPLGANNLGNFLASRQIIWKFIAPLAPWQGGLYERIVGIVKDAFKRSLGTCLLNLEELRTFVAEAEAAINCRPLTYVSGEVDAQTVLRPVDFLLPSTPQIELGLGGPGLEEEDKDEDDDFRLEKLSSGEELRKKWRKTREVLGKFWNRWTGEYLLALREKSKWAHRNGRNDQKREPIPGELVLVEAEGRPRNVWPLARIVEVQGAVAKILMGNGKSLVRSINKLVPLEANEDVAGINGEGDAEKKLGRLNESKATNRQELPRDQRTGDGHGKAVAATGGQQGSRKAAGVGHPMLTRAKTKAAMVLSLLAIFFLFLGADAEKWEKCRDCTIKCMEYGVAATAPVEGKIEICCMGSCLMKPGIKDLGFQLPKEVLLLDYDCRMTFWDKRRKRYRNFFRCPPIEQCKLVKCALCWELIFNPECWSKEQLVGIGGIAGLLLLLAGCILSMVIRICWLPLRALKWCFSRKKGKQKQQAEEELLGGRKRSASSKSIGRRNRRLWKLGFLAAIFVSFGAGFGIVAGDLEVAAVSASSENCLREAGNLSCTIFSATTLTLLPAGQVVALALKSDQGMMMGAIEVRMDSLLIHCNKNVLKKVKSYGVKVFSAKRCPGFGTCKEGKCKHVREGEIVEEMAEVAHYPGVAGCLEGQSLWAYECGLPSPACYFYRFYAMEVDQEKWDLVECASWEYKVQMKIRLEKDGNSSFGEFELYPGMSYDFKGIKFMLAAISSQPPSPALLGNFLVGDQGVAFVRDFHTDLSCIDEGLVNCTLDKGACKECWLEKDEEMIKCACRNLDISEIFRKGELPINTHQLQLKSEGTKIFSEVKYVPIQIIVKLEGLKLAVEMEMTSCELLPGPLTGCYECATGGQFEFACTAESSAITAEVSCDGGLLFTAQCGKEGIDQRVVLPFDRANINVGCTVKCPGGGNNFTIEGKLEFILPEDREFIIPKSKKGVIEGEESQLGKIWKMWEGLDWKDLIWSLMNWKVALGAVVVIFALLVGLRLFLFFNPVFRGYRFLVGMTIILFLAALGGSEAGKNCRSDGTLMNSLNQGSGEEAVLALFGESFHCLLPFTDQKMALRIVEKSLTDFAAQVLGCSPSSAAWRVWSSYSDRRQVQNALKYNEREQGTVVIMTRDPNDGGGRMPITGIGQWTLQGDLPAYGSVPAVMDRSWWGALATVTADLIKIYATEREGQRICTGPGILLRHPISAVWEFYPWAGIIVVIILGPFKKEEGNKPADTQDEKEENEQKEKPKATRAEIAGVNKPAQLLSTISNSPAISEQPDQILTTNKAMARCLSSYTSSELDQLMSDVESDHGIWGVGKPPENAVPTKDPRECALPAYEPLETGKEADRHSAASGQDWQVASLNIRVMKWALLLLFFLLLVGPACAGGGKEKKEGNLDDLDEEERRLLYGDGDGEDGESNEDQREPPAPNREGDRQPAAADNGPAPAPAPAAAAASGALVRDLVGEILGHWAAERKGQVGRGVGKKVKKGEFETNRQQPKRRRFEQAKEKKCFKCGDPEHMVADCPEMPGPSNRQPASVPLPVAPSAPRPSRELLDGLVDLADAVNRMAGRWWGIDRMVYLMLTQLGRLMQNIREEKRDKQL